MAKNNCTSENSEIQLVAPVKILVKPGLNVYETTISSSSLKKRSKISNEISSKSTRSGRGGESDNIFLVSHHVKKPIQKRGRQREASIKFQDGENKNVAYYLKHYFRLMYFTGMSTYNPDKKDDGKEESWIYSILSCLQKAIFWTITFFSLGLAILLAKLNWVIFLWDKGVLRFINVGVWLFAIVSDIYFIYLFAFSHKRIKEATETLNELGNYTIEEAGRKNRKCHNPHKLITVMFAATLLACFMQPMGGTEGDGWTPNKQILESSLKLSHQLFISSPHDLDDNSTKLEYLGQKYSTKLTPITIIMGLSELGMSFSSNMKMDTTQNMGVLIAVLVYLRNRYFGRKVKNIDIETYADIYDTDELDNPDGLYAEFQQMKKENRMMNALAGGLLKIVHAHNLLQCAIFLMRCLDGDASLTQFAFLVYGLVKVAAIYYFGKKAEAQNEVYEEWMRKWATHSRDPVFLARVLVILDGMTKAPLAVGRENFLVGQGFIFRFIGFVSSIFMLEVDDDDDNENN